MRHKYSPVNYPTFDTGLTLAEVGVCPCRLRHARLPCGGLSPCEIRTSGVASANVLLRLLNTDGCPWGDGRRQERGREQGPFGVRKQQRRWSPLARLRWDRWLPLREGAPLDVRLCDPQLTGPVVGERSVRARRDAARRGGPWPPASLLLTARVPSDMIGAADPFIQIEDRRKGTVSVLCAGRLRTLPALQQHRRSRGCRAEAHAFVS